MSDIQQTIKAALDAASLPSGIRNFWGTAPDGTVTPYTVASRVANAPENTLSSGVPINNTRAQIDCYAIDYAGAQALANAVNAVMTGLPSCVMLLDADVYESDVKLHRVTQDYSIWN